MTLGTPYYFPVLLMPSLIYYHCTTDIAVISVRFLEFHVNGMILFYLGSFTQHSYFEIHPSWMLLCQWFIPFYCCSSLSSMEILLIGIWVVSTPKAAVNIHGQVFIWDLCFHFSWVNTLEWNDWDIWWVCIWLSKELSNCFPEWFSHFTLLQSVYLSSGSF